MIPSGGVVAWYENNRFTVQDKTIDDELKKANEKLAETCPDNLAQPPQRK